MAWRIRTAIGRKWREGKVRPLPGNSPHDRLVSRGSLLVKESLRRSPTPPLVSRSSKNTEAPQYAFLKAPRNLSIRWIVVKLGAGCRLPLVGPGPS